MIRAKHRTVSTSVSNNRVWDCSALAEGYALMLWNQWTRLSVWKGHNLLPGDHKEEKIISRCFTSVLWLCSSRQTNKLTGENTTSLSKLRIRPTHRPCRDTTESKTHLWWRVKTFIDAFILSMWTLHWARWRLNIADDFIVFFQSTLFFLARNQENIWLDVTCCCRHHDH